MKTDAAHAPPRSVARLGTSLLFGGVVLLILRAIEAADGISGLPRFWYTNDTMWWAVAIGSVAAGTWCLAPQENRALLRWKPSRSGIRFQHLVIYTRAGCHLCDEALHVLQQYQRWLPLPTEVDIDHHPDLVGKYDRCVPVVLCDGKVRFKGRVEPVLLQRLIEGTPPA